MPRPFLNAKAFSTYTIAPLASAAGRQIKSCQLPANSAVRTISSASAGALSVFAADMDRDGDLDVLSASRDDNKIAWYENDRSQTFTEHVISKCGRIGQVGAGGRREWRRPQVRPLGTRHRAALCRF
jgi:hypothetical protein